MSRQRTEPWNPARTFSLNTCKFYVAGGIGMLANSWLLLYLQQVWMQQLLLGLRHRAFLRLSSVMACMCSNLCPGHVGPQGHGTCREGIAQEGTHIQFSMSQFSTCATSSCTESVNQCLSAKGKFMPGLADFQLFQSSQALLVLRC